jgi:hypothetical protein
VVYLLALLALKEQRLEPILRFKVAVVETVALTFAALAVLLFKRLVKFKSQNLEWFRI